MATITADEIIHANARTAAKLTRALTDIEVVSDVLELEATKESPRKTVLNAAVLRRDTLRLDAAAPAEPTEDPAAEVAGPAKAAGSADLTWRGAMNILRSHDIDKDNALQVGSDRLWWVDTTDGVFLQSDVGVYETHNRGKNWVAVVEADRNAPGGLARDFLGRGRGEKVEADEIEAGDQLEVAGDYYTMKGRKSPSRSYVRVLAVEDDRMLVIGNLGSDSKRPKSEDADKAEAKVIKALQPLATLAADADEDLPPEPTLEPTVEPTVEPAANEPEVTSPTPQGGQGSPADDCAGAFFAALRKGDAGLVAALLAEVRREDADDATMAEALVNAYRAAAPAKRTRRAASASPATPRRATDIDYAKADGITFTFTRNEWTATATVSEDGSFTVQAGSKVNPGQKRGSKPAQLKEELTAKGALDGESGVLNEDITLPSASAAAVFVCGDSVNGLKVWRDEDGRDLRSAYSG